MSYRDNKKRAIFINTEPTETDQSQGYETDINVIVGKYGIGNTAQGPQGQPIYADWTSFPTDLREMIETGRRLEEHRNRLPPELRDKSYEELLALTSEELTAILTPAKQPDTPPAPQP